MVQTLIPALEEPVLAVARLELIRQRRLDLPDPTLDRLLVHAPDECRGVQAQVVS